MVGEIDGSVPPRSAAGMVPEEVVVLPVARGPHWSRREPASAVRTDVAKDIVDARGAERALEATDAGVLGVWRQRSIAVFAVGSQFEHRFVVVVQNQPSHNQS